jgi:hypothetical protein
VRGSQRFHGDIPFNPGCTQCHVSNVSPANIAKIILDELKAFHLLNLLKHSFWYLAGLFTCFLVLSVRCHTVQRQLLGLGDGLHWDHLRNKKGGDVESGV